MIVLNSTNRCAIGHRAVQGMACGAAIAMLAGCGILPSHVHNAERLKTAETARDELASYREKAPELYAAMLQNLERFKQEEDWLIAELAANADTAFITKLPTATGEWLREDRKKIRKEIEELNVQLRQEMGVDAPKTDNVNEEIKASKTAVKAAKEGLTCAKATVTEWNAQTAFFHVLLAEGPKLKSGITAGNLTLGSAFDLAKGFAEKEVAFKGADGKDKKRKIKDFLKPGKKPDDDDKKPKDAAKSSCPATDRKNQRLPIAFNPILKAPGLAVELANLGLKLAQAEQKRAEEQLGHLRSRAEVFEKTLLEMELASELVKLATKSGLAKKETIQGYLESGGPAGGQNKTKINNVHDRLLSLRYQALARSIIKRSAALFRLELARLSHERSIHRSRNADDVWHTLAGSGLEGLVAYERGGLKPEHLANILRLAQAAALVAIAN